MIYGQYKTSCPCVQISPRDGSTKKSSDYWIRPRAPTNEKLERYKFMLINIEPDADVLDPGTFGLMEDSYLGFEFNDYPAEVLCPFPNQNTSEETRGMNIFSGL